MVGNTASRAPRAQDGAVAVTTLTPLVKAGLLGIWLQRSIFDYHLGTGSGCIPCALITDHCQRSLQRSDFPSNGDMGNRLLRIMSANYLRASGSRR